MSGRISRQLIPLAAGAVVALALIALTGCGGTKSAQEPQPAPAKGSTALEALPVATSALSTTAPDAKLLVVQTAQSVTSTSTPVWAYLFGDQKSDKTYLVYVVDGQVVNATEYGTVGMSEAQWAEVPDSSEWKVDSDVAYKSAVSSSGQTGQPTFAMGMQVYVPTSDEQTQTAEPMVWYVYLGDEATKPIAVDARTGAVTAE